MTGLGTIINSAAIIAGGLVGHLAGRLFRREQQEALTRTCGVSVLFIAVAGAMQGMLQIDGGKILSSKSMLVVLCLALGTIAGELIGIEKGFERFGEWLKRKTGNSGDREFVNAFVTASLTVCIGAMAIVGAIQDGISGDYSTLAVKAVLDFIIIAVMTSSLGKGSAFSAIPVFLFEGAVTLLARLVSPVMTETAVAYLSLIGSVLIFCVGLNLVWGKKLRVANMLPAVLFAVAAPRGPVCRSGRLSSVVVLTGRPAVSRAAKTFALPGEGFSVQPVQFSGFICRRREPRKSISSPSPLGVQTIVFPK